MSKPAYTLATYRVKPGEEENFIATWHQTGASVFVTTGTATLGNTDQEHNRSLAILFFRSWKDAAHVKAKCERIQMRVKHLNR